MTTPAVRQRTRGQNVPPAQVRHDFPIPNPPDLRLHVLSDYDLEDVFGYINPQMLYVRHLGYKGRFAEDLAAGEQAAVELRDSVRRVEDLMLAPQRHFRQRGVQVLPLPFRRAIIADLFPGWFTGAGAVLLRPPIAAGRPVPVRLRTAPIQYSLFPWERGKGEGKRAGRNGLCGYVRDVQSAPACGT